jgi:acyl-CoA synthetase (AMP-forming)/AMP-acid ligase II
MTSSREPRSLVEILRRRAEREPDRVGFEFLEDGEDRIAEMSYGALDRRARAIAALLTGCGAEGEPVLLLYPPGLEYIAALLGCFYAGAIAVPAYPPDPGRLSRTLPRLTAIAEDSRARFALTTSPIHALVGVMAGSGSGLPSLSWLATDTIDLEMAEEWIPPAIGPDAVAFLQYTSGSTGLPKGVVVRHDNLMHNSREIERRFEHGRDSRGLIWLPPYHDMGLIGGILQPLFVGFCVTLMSPVDFLKRPLRWLRAVSRTRATTSGGPNFAYDLCVRKIGPDERAGLDLGAWKVAFSGAEPVRAETIERFSRAFADCGFRRSAFYPCYGLAEATLLVAGGRAGTGPTVLSVSSEALARQAAEPAADGEREVRRLVACGTAISEHEIAIVDAESGIRCGPAQVGEIWVTGPGLGGGYWRQPDQSARTFGAQLPDGGGRRFLRTGDLGFLASGDLYVVGRIKDVIVVRGLKHHADDIERTAEQSAPEVRAGCCAAFAIEGHEDRVVVVAELDRKVAGAGVASPDTLRAAADAIRIAVSEAYGFALSGVALVPPGSIAKTSSGKLQRHACRAAYLAGGFRAHWTWEADQAVDPDRAGKAG